MELVPKTTEDPDLREKLQKCLEYLRKHKVDPEPGGEEGRVCGRE